MDFINQKGKEKEELGLVVSESIVFFILHQLLLFIRFLWYSYFSCFYEYHGLFIMLNIMFRFKAVHIILSSNFYNKLIVEKKLKLREEFLIHSSFWANLSIFVMYEIPVNARARVKVKDTKGMFYACSV